MRCPNCNKFASYEDEPTCETQSFEIAETESGGSVNTEVRVVLQCSDCGEELKETVIEKSTDFGHDCHEQPPEGECKFELEDEGEPTGTTRYDGNGRAKKTFYGFEQDVKLRCTCCGAEIEVQLKEDEQASSFDELV